MLKFAGFVLFAFVKMELIVPYVKVGPNHYDGVILFSYICVVLLVLPDLYSRRSWTGCLKRILHSAAHKNLHLLDNETVLSIRIIQQPTPTGETGFILGPQDLVD